MYRAIVGPRIERRSGPVSVSPRTATVKPAETEHAHEPAQHTTGSGEVRRRWIIETSRGCSNLYGRITLFDGRASAPKLARCRSLVVHCSLLHCAAAATRHTPAVVWQPPAAPTVPPPHCSPPPSAVLPTLALPPTRCRRRSTWCPRISRDTGAMELGHTTHTTTRTQREETRLSSTPPRRRVCSAPSEFWRACLTAPFSHPPRDLHACARGAVVTRTSPQTMEA